MWRSWSEVQLSCSAITGNAMLIAPTGTGKTEGALLWALSNRRGAERIMPDSRVSTSGALSLWTRERGRHEGPGIRTESVDALVG